MFWVNIVFRVLIFGVSISAIDCLERLVSEMICYVSSGMLNPADSLIQLMLFNMYWHGSVMGTVGFPVCRG